MQTLKEAARILQQQAKFNELRGYKYSAQKMREAANRLEVGDELKTTEMFHGLSRTQTPCLIRAISCRYPDTKPYEFIKENYHISKIPDEEGAYLFKKKSDGHEIIVTDWAVGQAVSDIIDDFENNKLNKSHTC